VRTLAPGDTGAATITALQEPPEETDADDVDVPDVDATADNADNDPTLRPPRSQREIERERERFTTPPLASSIDVPASTPTAPAPRVQSVAVSVDPKSQLISLRLSYTSALIGGFAFLILIALAILIGKTLSRGPTPAIATTDTKTLRQNPPTPGVMKVGRRAPETETRGIAGANDTEGASQGARPTAGVSTGTRNPQRPAYNDPQPPATFFTDDPKRQQGLNYAIVQSYPNRETAAKAAEFLTKNGVPCTVERDLPRWPLPWKEGCAVVGIRGFGKTRDNPELEAYKRTIEDLSNKFAGGRARFNAFDPRMYQWDKAN
jgi:hypothetical protein